MKTEITATDARRDFFEIVKGAAEKHEILRFVANENAGRLPLVAGVGGNDTLKVAKELNTINLEGYNAILSVTPYYNRPTQEGIYQHFSYLAQQSPLPLLIYNVPSRTGVNMLPETVVRLAKDHDSIIGVKEACGDTEVGVLGS